MAQGQGRSRFALRVRHRAGEFIGLKVDVPGDLTTFGCISILLFIHSDSENQKSPNSAKISRFGPQLVSPSYRAIARPVWWLKALPVARKNGYFFLSIVRKCIFSMQENEKRHDSHAIFC